MIGLFSTSDDQSTTDVCRWLRYLAPDARVLRVNSDERQRIRCLTVDADHVIIDADGQQVDLTQLATVWYRKGRHWLCNLFHPVDMPSRPALAAHLRERLKQEETRLSQVVHDRIERRSRHLGSSRAVDLNKLLVLDAAAACGFTVPRYCVSTSTRDLANAVTTFAAGAITKALSDGLYFFDHEDTARGYFSYTEEAGLEPTDDRSAMLAPSLVQEKIAKQFDLRVFYLDGVCHAMAIFSQADDQTKVDFRRYNDRHPNRMVPYDLPAEVKTHLCQLFSSLGLNTGSADLIVDEAGDHVFLEINPVGQFGMVSDPCNAHLEREVARWLLRHE